ncbi:MAG: aquaporin family protein [Planctomycetes bacterium]|nr:aquaporin family protein [Planctomycetota bacterium]
MNAFLAEFVGTMILVLLGNGVVANVLLKNTNGHKSGWLVITVGWGIAVFVGATIANQASGAHLNPAVSAAKLTLGDMTTETALTYIAAQLLGAIVGGALVFFFYRNHFEVSDSADDKLACFACSPSLPGNGQAFLCEVIGTFVLVFCILHFQDPILEGSGGDKAKLGLGSIGLLQVAFLVVGIGLSLGGTTGYAINPARDLGPRIAHYLLPIGGKRDSNWSYSWVPVVGPLAGGVLAALVYRILAL